MAENIRARIAWHYYARQYVITIDTAWNASAIDLELLASRLQYLRRDGAMRPASGT